MIDRLRSASSLSMILAVFMAVPSNIPLNFAFGSPPIARGSSGATRAGVTLARKLDRIALLGWLDSSTVGDNAEETDDTPFHPAIVSRFFDLSRLIPSSILGRGPRRAEVSAIGLRNPPLRC